MIETGQALTVLQDPRSLPGLRDVTYLPPRVGAHGREASARAEGVMRIGEWEVGLRILLPRGFPFVLPEVEVINTQELPRHPHVSGWGGSVCYIRSSGVMVDQTDPVGVVAFAVDEARRTLEEGWLDPRRAEQEWRREFGALWTQVCGPASALSFLKVDDVMRPVWVGVRVVTSPLPSPGVRGESFAARDVRRQQAQRSREATRGRRGGREKPASRWEVVWVADEPRPPPALPLAQKGVKVRRALYVPLPEAPVPPLPRLPGWDEGYSSGWHGEGVRGGIRELLGTEGRSQLDALLGQVEDDTAVLLSVPRVREGRTLIGLTYHGLRGVHPLSAGRGGQRQLPDPELFALHQVDRGTLQARGGAQLELAGKRVLLIGCGSVGGHVAQMLASAGVGDLTLMDGDRLAWENAFRHTMGLLGLHDTKVEALAQDLRARVPYVRVTPVAQMLPLGPGCSSPGLRDFDLVIDATGEPTVSMSLAARPNLFAGTTVIHTWLEPLGLGGHAMVSRPGEGCFTCLLGRDDPAGPLFFGPAFAQPGQDFQLDELGCGSYYAPFSDLDARRSAELATRLALDVLRGKAGGAVLRSWKGDAAEFRAHGYVTTPWYDAVTPDVLTGGIAYRSPRCPQCGEHG